MYARAVCMCVCVTVYVCDCVCKCARACMCACLRVNMHALSIGMDHAVNDKSSMASNFSRFLWIFDKLQKFSQHIFDYGFSSIVSKIAKAKVFNKMQ